MEAILFAILFTIPGLMVRNIEKRLYTKTKENDTDYVKQYNFFIDSVFIYLIGLILFEIFYTPISNLLKGIELHGIFLTGDNLIIFIGYFIWSLIICYPYTRIKRLVVKNVFLSVSNMFRKKNKLSIETEFSSVWDEVFENPDICLENQILVIEKDGALISQGYLKSYSPPHLCKREFLLEETEGVKAYLERDRECSLEEKLLSVKMEYFDSSTGYVYKLMDSTKLNEYLKNNK